MKPRTVAEARTGNGSTGTSAPALVVVPRARKLDVDAALRRALEHDELVVHYQPIVDLRDVTLLGVEALARWNRPGHGTLDASQFIAVAEETGLIVDLGRIMFARAAADSARWNVEHPDRALVMHINLSARQFGHNRLVDDVRQVLFESGARPETLCVEVTETALMTDTPVVRQDLLDLGCTRAQGFLFAPALAPTDLGEILAVGRVDAPVATG